MVTSRRDDYSEYVRQLFPSEDKRNMEVVRNITFQITGDCNCAVPTATSTTRAAAS